MTTTDTTPRIVCPSWCDRTQEDHLESLEAEGDHQPWHRSNDIEGDGWRVFISGFSTLDGRPVNERGSCPDIVVEAEVWTAQDAAQVVAAIQCMGGHLEARLVLHSTTMPRFPESRGIVKFSTSVRGVRTPAEQDEVERLSRQARALVGAVAFSDEPDPGDDPAVTSVVDEVISGELDPHLFTRMMLAVVVGAMRTTNRLLESAGEEVDPFGIAQELNQHFPRRRKMNEFVFQGLTLIGKPPHERQELGRVLQVLTEGWAPASWLTLAYVTEQLGVTVEDARTDYTVARFLQEISVAEEISLGGGAD